MVNLYDLWEAIRGAAGLEDLRLHDLRHSHASIGVSAGLSLPVVGRLLGHTVAQTTQRYAHVAPDPVRQASELIGAAITKAMGNGEKAGARPPATLRVHLLVEGNKPACGRPMKVADDVSFYLARVTCPGCRRKGAAR
jgi:hypothetical protein